MVLQTWQYRAIRDRLSELIPRNLGWVEIAIAALAPLAQPPPLYTANVVTVLSQTAVPPTTAMATEPDPEPTNPIEPMASTATSAPSVVSVSSTEPPPAPSSPTSVEVPQPSSQPTVFVTPPEEPSTSTAEHSQAAANEAEEDNDAEDDGPEDQDGDHEVDELNTTPAPTHADSPEPPPPTREEALSILTSLDLGERTPGGVPLHLPILVHGKRYCDSMMHAPESWGQAQPRADRVSLRVVARSANC